MFGLRRRSRRGANLGVARAIRTNNSDYRKLHMGYKSARRAGYMRRRR